MSTSGNKKKIIILVNTDWFFLLHRKEIAKAFQNHDNLIIVVTKDTGRKSEIMNLGFDFIDVDFDRKGTNFFYELKIFFKISSIYKNVRPVLVYQITVKPIIYGSFLANFLGIKVINTVCGLGYVFSKDSSSILRILVSKAYQLVINSNNVHTFFENRDDQYRFLKLGILRCKSRSTVVNGAGVDLNKFRPFNKLNKDRVIFLLAARMLWDKGIKEFVECAKILNNKYNNKIEFRLYGMVDRDNLQAIPEEYLNIIGIENYLKWYGFKKNMVAVYKESDVVVLPSYYGEGLPTVLAEACAMGLPVITTDSVGCRECVEQGINGFMIPIKSSVVLAKAVEKLFLDENLRVQMGKASRKLAVYKFDQEDIIEAYKSVYYKLLE